jgi:hypothetical protein
MGTSRAGGNPEVVGGPDVAGGVGVAVAAGVDGAGTPLRCAPESVARAIRAPQAAARIAIWAQVQFHSSAISWADLPELAVSMTVKPLIIEEAQSERW